jgi:hypothetical protein
VAAVSQHARGVPEALMRDVLLIGLNKVLAFAAVIGIIAYLAVRSLKPAAKGGWLLWIAAAAFFLFALGYLGRSAEFAFVLLCASCGILLYLFYAPRLGEPCGEAVVVLLLADCFLAVRFMHFLNNPAYREWRDFSLFFEPLGYFLVNFFLLCLLRWDRFSDRRGYFLYNLVVAAIAGLLFIVPLLVSTYLYLLKPSYPL